MLSFVSSSGQSLHNNRKVTKTASHSTIDLFSNFSVVLFFYYFYGFLGIKTYFQIDFIFTIEFYIQLIAYRFKLL